LISQSTNASEGAQVIKAVDFGVKADGVTDDGAAIDRMLQAAADIDSAVTFLFPENRTIRVTNAPDRYVLRFHRSKNRTVNGRGCTFMLGPDVRFLRLTESTNFALRNLNVDFQPLPFVDGTIVAVEPANRSIDVRISTADHPTNWEMLPLGRATREDGEQAFFGMHWRAGPYGTVSDHYYIDRMEPLTGFAEADENSERIVRVFESEQRFHFDRVEPGRSQISLPVPGIAHRFGPGACFEIWDCDTVQLENVELWSAPWFGFRVFRNRGEVTFRKVCIRPKPNSGQLSSTWRDGFHVKGNSASLLWEDCILSGMNDDAFNISNHCSLVREIESPTSIIVQQWFPLSLMPWRVGETIAAADFESRTMLGRATVTKVTPLGQRVRSDGRPFASPVRLELDRPIEGLARRSLVWHPAWANPKTVLRRCTIEKSCRLQTPITIDDCHVTAFLWFYCEDVEGPFPADVTIRDSTIRRGRGNSNLVMSFKGRITGAPGPSSIENVLLQNNRIYGGVIFQGVDNLRLENNTFAERGALLRLKDNRSVISEGNRDSDGEPIELKN